MRLGLVLVVLALGCGKSDPPAPAPASGAASGSAGSAPGSASGSGSAVAAVMTDAELEKMLRDSLELFTALAGVTGLSCADKATQMHRELDKHEALLAQFGKPQPANDPEIADRFAAVAERTGLKDPLQLAVARFEDLVRPCASEAAIAKVMERVQQR